jgi:hypothetical protein
MRNSIPPAAMRRVATETAMGPAAAAIDVNLPKKSH